VLSNAWQTAAFARCCTVGKRKPDGCLYLIAGAFALFYCEPARCFGATAFAAGLRIVRYLTVPRTWSLDLSHASKSLRTTSDQLRPHRIVRRGVGLTGLRINSRLSLPRWVRIEVSLVEWMCCRQPDPIDNLWLFRISQNGINYSPGGSSVSFLPVYGINYFWSSW